MATSEEQRVPDGTETAGGGTQDVTGPDAAAHVDQAQGDHADSAGHGASADDHGDVPPGPIDWAAWRAAAIGVAIAGLICLLLYLAIS